jgi:hypothetical protein
VDWNDPRLVSEPLQQFNQSSQASALSQPFIDTPQNFLGPSPQMSFSRPFDGLSQEAALPQHNLDFDFSFLDSNGQVPGLNGYPNFGGFPPTSDFNYAPHVPAGLTMYPEQHGHINQFQGGCVFHPTTPNYPNSMRPMLSPQPVQSGLE